MSFVSQRQQKLTGWLPGSSTDANRQLPITGHATHSPPSNQHPQSPPSHTCPNSHSHSYQSAETSITDAPAR